MYMWNQQNTKKKNLLNITTTTTKSRHRYREQTSGYQWGEGSGRDNKMLGE